MKELIAATQEERKMSSLEISELMNKKHLHVMRDIRSLIDVGAITQSNFGLSEYKDASGKTNPMYLLDFEATMTLITGYDAKRRAAVVRRWNELEKKVANLPQNTIALPNFLDPAAAAIAWAEQYTLRITAEKTKAQIGARREATAMNTASQATKRANKLEGLLDHLKEYSSIKRMEMIFHGQKFNWRELKSASQIMELPPIDVFDQNYGSVKAYHRNVWKEVYAVDAEGNYFQIPDEGTDAATAN